MCDLKNYKNSNINLLANPENIINLLQNITKITPQNITHPHSYGIIQSIIIEAIYNKEYFANLIYLSLFSETQYKILAKNMVDFIMDNINNTPDNVCHFDRLVHRELVYKLQFHHVINFL